MTPTRASTHNNTPTRSADQPRTSGWSNDVFRMVVVAPSFNNAATLRQVIDDVLQCGHPLIVVDDGSTDGASDILTAAAESTNTSDNLTRLTVVTHSTNRGKGAALLTGFREAIDLGFTHALTIDTDGQHTADDIAGLETASRTSPHALVIGAREYEIEHYPRASRFGRTMSNRMVRIESGGTVTDTQSGMRIYPLKLVSDIACISQRFNYEVEIVTRARWAGLPVVEAPIHCRYPPPSQRVSHYRPWMDTLHAIRLHARLLLETPRRRIKQPRRATHTQPAARTV